MDLLKCAQGLSELHLAMDALERPVHAELVIPLQELKRRARAVDLELCIVSGFRSFERQLAIWNAKALGQRPLLGVTGEALDVASLTEKERLFAILRWSALPGASRHHWGSDVDVFDAAAINVADVQLISSEYCGAGPCAELYDWLKSGACEDFYWPYAQDCGGVSPEPWHISYAPVANRFKSLLSREVVLESVRGADIVLKKQNIENFDEIYSRFILPGLV